jgi:hypothetical protein
VKESHVPVFGTSDGKLDSRGSRDDYLGPPEYATESWERKLQRGLPDHDVVLRQTTRYVVFFHRGPPPGTPHGHRTDRPQGRVCAGSVEAAKECGDRHLDRQPAYVMDVLTGRCFEVWGKAAALGGVP